MDPIGVVVDSTSAFAPALVTSEAPAVIVLAGLQGSGKTTTAARLALYLKEREVDYNKVDSEETPPNTIGITNWQPKTERRVLLVAADLYRPAAIKQLQVLADSIGVEVFVIEGSLDPVVIAARAGNKAKEEGYDTVLIDTAGRQGIDTN